MKGRGHLQASTQTSFISHLSVIQFLKFLLCLFLIFPNTTRTTKLLEGTCAAGRPTLVRQIDMTLSRLHRASWQNKKGERWTSVCKNEKVTGAHRKSNQIDLRHLYCREEILRQLGGGG
jgi:hypothetical protein